MHHRRKREHGFTLIELLVTLAIIAALAALLTPTLRRARIRAMVNSGHQEIQRLALALESFQSDYGDYPPTDIEEFYEVTGNDLNSGIESLVGHLATRSKGGPYFEFKDEHISNLDEDSISSGDVLQELNWSFGDSQLREYLDPWDIPYIYFHNRDYERSFAVYHQNKQKTQARAGFSAKTANYYSLTTFQIWSVGPNRKNENGEGDDIGSW
ncbi:MAG: prepilin-type N-terminal cleavage/methylation domain-containing protein [Planctomycetota bacterium]